MGPYSVGTKAIEVKDPNRKMLRYSGIKRWMVQAFYPAQKHEEVYSYYARDFKGRKNFKCEGSCFS